MRSFHSWKCKAYIVQCPCTYEVLQPKFEFTVGKAGAAWGPCSCSANCCWSEMGGVDMVLSLQLWHFEQDIYHDFTPLPLFCVMLTRQNKPPLTKEDHDLLSYWVITSTAEQLSTCWLTDFICSKPEIPGGRTQEIYPDCVLWFRVLGPGRQNG